MAFVRIQCMISRWKGNNVASNSFSHSNLFAFLGSNILTRSIQLGFLAHEKDDRKYIYIWKIYEPVMITRRISNCSPLLSVIEIFTFPFYWNLSMNLFVQYLRIKKELLLAEELLHFIHYIISAFISILILIHFQSEQTKQCSE